MGKNLAVGGGNRRAFVALIGAGFIWPVLGKAAEPGKAHRVGFLGNSTAALEANLIRPFRDGLRELGYEEGKNLVIEFRWADGKYDRFPALVAELLAAKVDVLVTAGTPATLAVQQAKTSVPLVMIAVGEPVGTGIAESLARPGGNITGLSSMAPELEGKRFELLREIVPGLSRVAVLWNPRNAFNEISMKQARAAAETLRIEILPLAITKTEELDAAFAAILRERPQALFIFADRVFLHNRVPIVEFAGRHRLPSINSYRELVEAGGLMSFGPSYEDMHRRAAAYVDKILKGANPAGLPIEQPTRFMLLVNLKAAKSLGVEVPSSLLLRADEVIE
jgi:putative tryptophan/tyrosine transport system substrate-binding protein